VAIGSKSSQSKQDRAKILQSQTEGVQFLQAMLGNNSCRESQAFEMKRKQLIEQISQQAKKAEESDFSATNYT